MKVFVSSVVQGMETERAAVKAAVEIAQFEALMCETFGARPYSSERACITEVESADVFVALLGERFGFEHAPGESVSQQEFRRAASLGIPILCFVADSTMEPRQAAFRDEIAEYHSGYFRETYTASSDLKDKTIAALLQLGRARKACSESAFRARLEQVQIERANWRRSQNDALFSIAFLPQPNRQIDLSDRENRMDDIFYTVCREGLGTIQAGYSPLAGPDYVGFESKSTQARFYEDGLVITHADPTSKNRESHFSSFYVPPSNLTRLGKAAFTMFEANGGWCQIGLAGMEHAVIAELPHSANSSFSMGFRSETAAAFARLLVPCTKATYNDWVNSSVARLQRRFANT